jgi:hypothetical protein
LTKLEATAVLEKIKLVALTEETEVEVEGLE